MSVISLPAFLRTGVTAAIFRAEETFPVMSEAFTMVVMWGKMTGRQFFKTVVGSGSSMQVVEFIDKTSLEIKSESTALKLEKARPEKLAGGTSTSSGATSQAIALWIFSILVEK